MDLDTSCFSQAVVVYVHRAWPRIFGLVGRSLHDIILFTLYISDFHAHFYLKIETEGFLKGVCIR